MSLQAVFLMLSPCTRTWSTIMLYISSATNDPWPHPLHFSFLLLFLFVSHYQDCQNTWSLVLLFISSWDSDWGVISLTTECSHMDKCVLFVILEVVILCVCVFWMRTWLNLCKMRLCLYRILKKTLSKLECVCKQVKCVKSFKKRVFVSRTVWMVWRIVSNE